MIELPEAFNISSQLKKAVSEKTVELVIAPTKSHKFCWYNGQPEFYNEKLCGSKVIGAEAFGIYAELAFDNGCRLCINDGVNVRLINFGEAPKNHQLLIKFSDCTALVFTVAMYGGIVLHDGAYDNAYYLKSRAALSPFSAEFNEYYEKIYSQSKPNLSAKALIATEQRFPGIGNGTAQDILFCAGLNPKRKLSTFTAADKARLLEAIVSVLREMTDKGGRDTEKDIYGNPGGYETRMSKKALSGGCPVCAEAIVKETYLGGSVYYCPFCQPIIK